jgi:hypothetical protein
VACLVRSLSLDCLVHYRCLPGREPTDEMFVYSETYIVVGTAGVDVLS